MIDGEAVVIDSETVVIDGEAAVIDGEAVVIDGESVVIDGEAVVIVSEAVVIDSGAVMIDSEAVVIDGEIVLIDEHTHIPLALFHVWVCLQCDCHCPLASENVSDAALDQLLVRMRQQLTEQVLARFRRYLGLVQQLPYDALPEELQKVSRCTRMIASSSFVKHKLSEKHVK